MTDGNIPAVPQETGTNAPKVIGILLVIFGSIYLFVSLLSAVFIFLGSAFFNALSGFGAAAAQKGGVNPNSLAALVAEIKSVYVIMGFEKLVVAAISGVALGAGVGLARFRPWGLKLAFWWAVGALAYLVADSGIYAGMILPMTMRFMSGLAGQMGSAPGQGNPSSLLVGPAGSYGIAGNIMINLIMAAMPVVTIVFMAQDRVKRACGVEKLF